MRSNSCSCVLALIVVSACGNHPPPVLIEPDAPDTPDAPPGRNIVVVETFGDSPTFIRYRSNNGEWREPRDTGKGYELDVVDDFELIAVCESSGRVDVGIEAGTAAETSTTYLPCFTPTESVPTVTVTGTMVQAGTVSLDAMGISTEPNWSFSLGVAPGTKDLFAIADTHAAIRRDVEITDATALAGIDVVAEGAPLVVRSFEIDSEPAELTRSSVLWFTSTSAAFFPSSPGTTVKLPPSELSEFGDQRYVELAAIGFHTYRAAYVRDTTTAPTTVELLPHLENVTFTATGATWSGTLPGAGADLFAAAGVVSTRIVASPGWLATRSSLDIDTDIPGFRAEWRIATPEYRGFSVNDSTALVFRSSTLDE